MLQRAMTFFAPKGKDERTWNRLVSLLLYGIFFETGVLSALTFLHNPDYWLFFCRGLIDEMDFNVFLIDLLVHLVASITREKEENDNFFK